MEQQGLRRHYLCYALGLFGGQAKETAMQNKWDNQNSPATAAITTAMQTVLAEISRLREELKIAQHTASEVSA